MSGTALRFRAPLLAALLLAALAGCTSPETRALRGDEYARLGHHALALREYQVARRKDPTLFDIDAKIRTTQVALYLQQGDQAAAACRWRDAERAYNEVQRVAPDHPEIEARLEKLAVARGDWHFERGQKLLIGGDPAGAITEFEQTLVHQPNHPRAREALSRAEHELAERVRLAETRYQDGLMARQRDELEQAMRRFEEALRLDPNHAGAAVELESIGAELVLHWMDQGDYAAMSYDWPAALEHYERARQYGADTPGLAHRIRTTKLEITADEWVRKGDDAFARSDWGTAYDCFERARHRSVEPERFIDRYRSARDRYAEMLFDDARSAEREGRYDDALAAYRRVSTFHPHFRDVQVVCRTLAQRLEDAENAYADGCHAVEGLDLMRAREHFLVCLSVVPGYLDARERVSQIDRELDLAASMYDRACRAQVDGDADRARILFEECLAITRPYRDIEERLDVARSVVFPGPDTNSDYVDGCQAQAERDLQRARKAFERCRDGDPEYRDTMVRLEDVVSALQRADDLYTQAFRAERDCELQKARDGYRECLELCNPYRDASNRLVKIDEAMRNLRHAHRLEAQMELVAAQKAYRQVSKRFDRHQFAKQRLHEIEQSLEQIDKEYRRLVDAEKRGELRVALSIAVALRDRCLGYEDVDERITRLEIEVDYQDAIEFESHDDHRRAVVCFERVVTRNPEYRDANDRLAVARQKAADQPKPGVRRGPPDGKPGVRRGPPEMQDKARRQPRGRPGQDQVDDRR